MLKSLTSKYSCVIGLEVHISLATTHKLFSGALHSSDAPSANTHVAPFDLALPGSLPVLNLEALEKAVVASHLTSSGLNNVSRFERKHYFYPDLPSGYQITQNRFPLASGGRLAYRHDDSSHFTSIKQIQLEQDSGKTVVLSSSSPSHSGAKSSLAKRCVLDYNRAGDPLIEVVFEPDIPSPAHAASAVRELVKLLRHGGVTNGRMERGEVRVDLNVSVREKDGEGGKKTALNERVEVKNLNSLKSILTSGVYEYNRQASLMSAGEVVVSETRTFDPSTGKTVLLRSKEDGLDYRFLVDPDLPPLRLDTFESKVLNIPELIASIPELPAAARDRLIATYGLIPDMARRIAEGGDHRNVAYFEEAVSFCRGLEAAAGRGDRKGGDKPSSSIVAAYMCNEVVALVKAGWRGGGGGDGETSGPSGPSSNADFVVEDAASSTSYSSVREDKAGDVTVLPGVNTSLSATHLGELSFLVASGEVTSKMGKRLVEVLHDGALGDGTGEGEVKDLAREMGMVVINDREGALTKICEEVVKDPKFATQLQTYATGGERNEKRIAKFFAGEVMKACKGNADVNALATVIEAVLERNRH